MNATTRAKRKALESPAPTENDPKKARAEDTVTVAAPPASNTVSLLELQDDKLAPTAPKTPKTPKPRALRMQKNQKKAPKATPKGSPPHGVVKPPAILRILD